ncbi:carbohydrate ABC transporter permease [bacterium]|nr:MAG: carbohydrate ABC transporter permease [bacterium]
MRIQKLLLYALMTVIAILMVAPLVWMVATSLKPEEEIRGSLFSFTSHTTTTENYGKLFDKAVGFPVGRWFFNSVFISSMATFCVLTLSSMAAFAFSRLRFRGREPLFYLLLATMLVPGQVSLIPVFLIVSKLGLFDTYAGVIVPGLGNAFGVFLLRQFFARIPHELEEAAVLDGATVPRIYWNVILPLAKPALATLGIFTFIGSWNDFVWPLLVTSDMEMRTLPVGLNIFQGQFATTYGITMAAAVITTVPMVIAFLIFQRRITEGIALTGLK